VVAVSFDPRVAGVRQTGNPRKHAPRDGEGERGSKGA